MSSEWRDSTTIQVKAERRAELEQLRLRLSLGEGQMLELREVADRVLSEGLLALGGQEGSGPEESEA